MYWKMHANGFLFQIMLCYTPSSSDRSANKIAEYEKPIHAFPMWWLKQLWIISVFRIGDEIYRGTLVHNWIMNSMIKLKPRLDIAKHHISEKPNQKHDTRWTNKRIYMDGCLVIQICYGVLCQRPTHHWYWLHTDAMLIEKPKSNTKEKEERWKYTWIWSSILQESPTRLNIMMGTAKKTQNMRRFKAVCGFETYNRSIHTLAAALSRNPDHNFSLLIAPSSLRLGIGRKLRDPLNNLLTTTWRYFTKKSKTWRSTWYLTSHPEWSPRISYTSSLLACTGSWSGNKMQVACRLPNIFKPSVRIMWASKEWWHGQRFMLLLISMEI